MPKRGEVTFFLAEAHALKANVDAWDTASPSLVEREGVMRRVLALNFAVTALRR